MFAALRRLAEEGKSVIFVSHKLADGECFCDRVTVMRQGEVVEELTVKGEDISLPEQRLIDWMFGRELAPLARPPSLQRRANPCWSYAPWWCGMSRLPWLYRIWRCSRGK